MAMLKVQKVFCGAYPCMAIVHEVKVLACTGISSTSSNFILTSCTVQDSASQPSLQHIATKFSDRSVVRGKNVESSCLNLEGPSKCSQTNALYQKPLDSSKCLQRPRLILVAGLSFTYSVIQVCLVAVQHGTGTCDWFFLLTLVVAGGRHKCPQ